MKDQATHIRLIRDENGKPVEAEYENPYWYNTQHDIYPAREWDNFNTWAQANRIPVTGDWPTDKHVFAKDEVEPVDELIVGKTMEASKVVTKLRLKTTPSDRQSEVTDYRERYKKIAESDSFKAAYNDRSLGEAIRVEGEGTVKEACNHEPLVDTGVEYYHCPACNQGWKYDDWKSAKEKRFQQGEELFEPKQEAKTADLPDFYSGSLNEKRIKKYRLLAEQYNISEGVARDIFSAGLDLYNQEAKSYKQQYQQEIIEKLEAATAELRKSLPKGPHIHALSLLSRVMSHLQSLDEIIQSTK